MDKIDTGDTVLHTPTNEEWMVACVQGSELSWCGWPEGRAALADCKLIKKATPEFRDGLLADLAKMKGGDHRQRYAIERVTSGANPQDALRKAALTEAEKAVDCPVIGL